MKIRISLYLASALALVSCEFGEPYDVIVGSARISRLHEPPPVIAKPVAPKPEPKPVVSQQQPVVNRPVAASAPKPAVYVPPTPRTVSHAASQQQPTHYNNSRLPIANPNWATPQNHRKATRDYPLMPGQNRGLKARRTVN